MKAHTAPLWTGLFTLAGAVTISCGGTSDDGGIFATGGTNNTAGTNTAGGTNSNTAGTAHDTGGNANSTGGTTTDNGGANNNNGGTNNHNGGGSGAGTGGAAGSGIGGAGANGCPARTPTAGSMCMQGDSPFQGCDYGDLNCRCRRGDGEQMRVWRCNAAQDADAVCPADAMDGDPCTGQGLCAGQSCFCNNQETNCF